MEAAAANASTLTTTATVVAFSASLVLAAGGAAKVRRPEPAARALRAARLPSARWLVRGVGLVEIAIGVMFLAAPGRVSAALLAGAYLGFGAFLAYLLVGDVAVESCGCAGERDVPPSWLHVALDLVAAGTAVLVAIAAPAPSSVWRLAAGRPFAVVAFAAALVLIAWLATLVVVFVPTLFGSYERSAAA